jgi:hypothetical protein
MGKNIQRYMEVCYWELIELIIEAPKGEKKCKHANEAVRELH